MADPTADVPIAEQARRRFVDDYSELLQNATFRRWLWHLIDDPSQCKAHGVSVVPPSGNEPLFENPIYTYFYEGRRSIGVALVVMAQRIAPKFFLYMLNEAMGLRNQQVSAPVQVRPPPQG